MMFESATEPKLLYNLEEDFFDRFNLKKVRLLGKGMAGEVFLTTSRDGSGRKWAVKLFALDEDVRERNLRHFTTEAGVLQAVSHPHIVPCIMAARCPDYAALAMPYYPRGDLGFLHNTQSPTEVHRYMSHVVRGLEHLHRQNIAHNDLKLENVLIDAQNRAHLGDLGLALEVKDASRTALAGLVGGTRKYWSPERSEANTQTRIDPFKADIYAFGVMYWVLVSGEGPQQHKDYRDKLADTKLNLSPALRLRQQKKEDEKERRIERRGRNDSRIRKTLRIDLAQKEKKWI
ncbi:rac family serine/threonine-protein kinase homolog [Plakobranchus ocellatus]|uniref:Rac family serine/threonine-protein kinase homolog n=1 Tax=Plakobranchus ocellatus TaxID=259542 RepID=A0AAV4A0G2_9GAST|nr:rac family serine/threonine-protein kinase homolog [Plakobranchus ocellatus]